MKHSIYICNIAPQPSACVMKFGMQVELKTNLLRLVLRFSFMEPELWLSKIGKSLSRYCKNSNFHNLVFITGYYLVRFP